PEEVRQARGDPRRPILLVGHRNPAAPRKRHGLRRERLELAQRRASELGLHPLEEIRTAQLGEAALAGAEPDEELAQERVIELGQARVEAAREREPALERDPLLFVDEAADPCGERRVGEDASRLLLARIDLALIEREPVVAQLRDADDPLARSIEARLP